MYILQKSTIWNMKNKNKKNTHLGGPIFIVTETLVHILSLQLQNFS